MQVIGFCVIFIMDFLIFVFILLLNNINELEERLNGERIICILNGQIFLICVMLDVKLFENVIVEMVFIYGYRYFFIFDKLFFFFQILGCFRLFLILQVCF